MRIRVLSVQRKDIRTKAGVDMTLRVVNGVNGDGEVFRFTLPRGHDEVAVGEAEVFSEPYINYEADLAGRLKVVALASDAARK